MNHLLELVVLFAIYMGTAVVLVVLYLIYYEFFGESEKRSGALGADSGETC